MGNFLVHYTQEKQDKKTYKSAATCELKLRYDNNILYYEGEFVLNYHRNNLQKNISFKHELELNTNTGDIKTTYILRNNNLTDSQLFNNRDSIKENNFKMLYELCENGFYRGEKRTGYWGAKYAKQLDKITKIILDILKPKFKTPYLYEKLSSEKVVTNKLFDMLVDFHLDMNNIKGHDSVYYDILEEYPKKKWLKLNDNKFLPAVLDAYGVKSKYLIKILSNNTYKPYNIASLNYICKLFGPNYISYLKQSNWMVHCFDAPPNKKTHELKNDVEKACMIHVMNNWEKLNIRMDSFVHTTNKLLSIREHVEKHGINLKFKARNDNDYDSIMEMWLGHKLHFSRGYKVRYSFPEEFVEFIEQPFIHNDVVCKPKILKSEDDFRIEGYVMKNCMAKQFNHGVIYIYVSLSCNRKKIDLQYKKGKLNQHYAKANTPVDPSFEPMIEILSERFATLPEIKWVKENFDHITN
jgi:hypothetical protein